MIIKTHIGRGRFVETNYDLYDATHVRSLLLLNQVGTMGERALNSLISEVEAMPKSRICGNLKDLYDSARRYLQHYTALKGE